MQNKYVKVLEDGMTVGSGVRREGDVVVNPPQCILDLVDENHGKHGAVVELVDRKQVDELVAQGVQVYNEAGANVTDELASRYAEVVAPVADDSGDDEPGDEE